MRRIVASEYEELDDVTTLAEPAMVEQRVTAHREG